MIDLVFGLHLYQPPNQETEILKKITEESYLPVVELILSHPKALFTVDVARSAIENFEKQKLGSYFIEKLKMAVGLNKISLVNTAAYHPILPLLPKKEIIRQALLNEACYQNLLKNAYQKPEGFFPPEMAFSPKLIPIFEELGYQWTVTADTPFACHHKHNPPFNWIPQQKNLAIFLRSDLWSNRIAFSTIGGKNFLRSLKQELKKWFGGERGYLIIWLDWETFGHHKPNFMQKFLTPFLDNLNDEMKLCLPSELLSLYPKKEIQVPPGSWSTTTEDFKHGNYWPLWKSPNSEFHKLWWKLARIILEIKKNVKSEKQLSLFDKAIYSCQTWQWSCGNKELAIKGMDYFEEIINLEEAKPQHEKAKQIIKKLENICN